MYLPAFHHFCRPQFHEGQLLSTSWQWELDFSMPMDELKQQRHQYDKSFLLLPQLEAHFPWNTIVICLTIFLNNTNSCNQQRASITILRGVSRSAIKKISSKGLSEIFYITCLKHSTGYVKPPRGNPLACNLAHMLPLKRHFELIQF